MRLTSSIACAVVLTIGADFVMAQSEQKAADYYFTRRDKNKDGVLSTKEQSRTLQSQITKWDKNRDGVIGSSEYLSYYEAYILDKDRKTADYYFTRQDKNKDGLLTKDEQSETLRNEITSWDKNRNGVVDTDEYITYYQALSRAKRDKQTYSNRSSSSNRDSRRRSDDRRDSKKQDAPPTSGETKLTVYNAENLPKGLPSWFASFDRNRDGQIALYEWKLSARPSPTMLTEFRTRDTNADGFITVEEMLRFEAFEEAKKDADSVRFKERIITPHAVASGTDFPQPSSDRSGYGKGRSGPSRSYSDSRRRR